MRFRAWLHQYGDKDIAKASAEQSFFYSTQESKGDYYQRTGTTGCADHGSHSPSLMSR